MEKDDLIEIKARIKYLEMEISHEPYWDGYALEGMKLELKKLNQKLKEQG